MVQHSVDAAGPQSLAHELSITLLADLALVRQGLLLEPVSKRIKRISKVRVISGDAFLYVMP